ncbi:DgyrCDS11561 [Dimorphilus gyrociliatus]|uniref:DgyrCDS11561 n=1 Tax=Dimorphilus gyrociliatus TaxID=2664684 RepID=A0A7I8W4N2_9ANNE|nr:DgyrCDS11561 [Dimorphilus gyrociliatus]
MVQITEDLIRKRAEHNECCLSNLEEVSLHQQDIEKIEHIDKWCRELKILYLQSNLIPKIENVGRLKKLQYLNLALNNVERIENLEGCEDLQKLDLTVNFIGELTSIEGLKKNIHLKEMYLTGNPCTEYHGYREYVVGTLTQLKTLDGIAIEKSERILALQNLQQTKSGIIEQQRIYQKKREKEKNKKKKPNTDWYTDIDNAHLSRQDEEEDEGVQIEELDDEEFHKKEEEFWNEKVPFTPESRVRVHEHMKSVKKRDEKRSQNDQEEKREKRLTAEDGRILNVNDAKVEFSLIDDEENNQFLLDVAVFKYMDTSLCDVDVQPNYVKVTLKGRVLQLVLTEEVKPDSSSAKRSQTTGHLLITMPKVNGIVKPKVKKDKNTRNNKKEEKPKTSQFLEFEEKKLLDYKNIVNSAKDIPKAAKQVEIIERENSETFVDDPDVPPLI